MPAATTSSSTPYVSLFPEEAPPSTEPTTTDRDLVGVAQTGSGKTLAYGLPILSFILSSPPSVPDSEHPSTRLAALILAPTRELALQVRAAISEVAIRTNALLPEAEQDPHVNAPRKRAKGQHVSVVALTGGMSVEKQKRQLSRGADILVATPGRLWDLIGEVRSSRWLGCAKKRLTKVSSIGRYAGEGDQGYQVLGHRRSGSYD
jgi:ATP-dependent helicase YprA (DUF1998 family)